jgi:hypothetical protein
MRKSTATATITAKDLRLGSLKQAAAFVGCDERTIRRWIAAGLIEGKRYGPRVLRVDLDELANLGRTIPTAYTV